MKESTKAVFLILIMVSASGCLASEGMGGKTTTPIDTTLAELPEGWDQIVSRTRGSPNLIGFTDCNQLENTIQNHITEEMRTNFLQMIDNDYWYGGWLSDDVMLDGDMAMPETASADEATGGAAPSTNREEGTDFSGTNNQEQGVDEADFVKTDGYNIYLLQNNRLFILGVPEFGNITYESNITIEGAPQSMLLTDNHIVVLSTVNAWNLEPQDPLYDMIYDQEDNWWRLSTLTKLTVINITNTSSLEPERELYIEGYYQTAREVDGTVRMVTHGYMEIPGVQWGLVFPDSYWEYDWEDPMRQIIRNETIYRTMEENMEIIQSTSLSELVPQVYERVEDSNASTTITTHPLTSDTCDDFVTSEDSTSRAFTSIFTLDLLDADFSFQADHLMTNWAQVYASQDVMVIAESANDWWWFWDNNDFTEVTNLHTFDISNPGETIYTGSGRINGTVLDQFSLSEHNGTLRVAATTGQWGRWWLSEPEPMENHVITLKPGFDSDTGLPILNQIGHIGGIAEGESIWSTRFVGDICYMVTFRNIDPLWTIDLSDPSSPEILGELEVPGVSTYIHPMHEDYLLTIGLPPAGDDGLGLDWSGVQVSQFNVSNLSDPTLLSTQILTHPDDEDSGISWNWGWSEATYEHKAFQYWAPKNMLAIPISTYGYDYSSEYYYYRYVYVSKLVLVNAEPGENLSIYGTIDHSDFYNGEENYYWDSSSIRRTIFMGDYVYAISPAGVTVHNLTTLSLTDSVEIWKPEFSNPYYYGDVAISEGEGEDTGEPDEESTTSSGSAEKDPDDS